MCMAGRPHVVGDLLRLQVGMHAVIRSDESTCSRLATSMVRVVCTDVGLFLGESFVQGLPLMCLGRCRHVPQVVRFPLRRAVSCLLYTSPSPRDRTRSRMP